MAYKYNYMLQYMYMYHVVSETKASVTYLN
jgi:hypothetical protein